MKKIILLLMISALLPMMLFAQSGRGPGGRMSDPSEQLAQYDEYLDLTEEQEAAFLDILTEFDEKLTTLMESGSRDRDKMMEFMEERDAELLSILKEDQSVRFAEFNEQMGQRGGRGGKAPRR